MRLRLRQFVDYCGGHLGCTIFRIGLDVYLLMLSMFIGYLLSDFFTVAQKPASLTILNDGQRVRPDEPITYEAQFYRQKNCQVDTLRYLIKPRADGVEVIAYRDRVPGFFVQGSDRVVRIIDSVMHVGPLSEGKYVLRIYSVSHCSIITRVDKYPDAAFDVVP